MKSAITHFGYDKEFLASVTFKSIKIRPDLPVDLLP
jgi:hypothetical protein